MSFRLPPLPAGPSILAVVVLYKVAPSDSESVRTLLHALRGNTDLSRYFSLTVYDNSPVRSEIDPMLEVPVHYLHDPTNAGLATAYNYALHQAAATGHDWLLLLDQDTSVTADYLAEMAACIAEGNGRSEIASIVPKLAVNGIICSPTAHFIDQLRHPYRRTHRTVGMDEVGVHKGRLVAYNSGAALRVSALRAIGGFPADYWLDYLDHAVFHALAVRGFNMYIMNATLNHDSSQADVSSVPVWRQRNLLLAQTLFVMQTGNFFDRLLYRIHLLRYSRGLSRSYPDKALWKEAALQAISLKRVSQGRNTP